MRMSRAKSWHFAGLHRLWLNPCRMKSILIVYHSKTGGTHQMAAAAARGAASEPDIATDFTHAADAGPDNLLQVSGYIFATPENLAMMSGMMKDFFDRTYYSVLDRIVGRPYGILVCAGSDGENAARQIHNRRVSDRRDCRSPDCRLNP